MAWIRSHKKSAGGGNQLTKVIDWATYSHPSAFDTIPMPANYTDYTHLLLAIKNAGTDAEWFDYLMESAFKYYQDKGALPVGYGSVFLVIPTSSITATDQNVDVPILAPYTTWENAFANYTPGKTYINSTRILGNYYSGSWADYQLVAYGVNIE